MLYPYQQVLTNGDKVDASVGHVARVRHLDVDGPLLRNLATAAEVTPQGIFTTRRRRHYQGSGDTDIEGWKFPLL